MAKKSSKKASNGTRKILDLVLFVLAGGMFGLLAMPFITGEASSVLGKVTNNISGYNLLDFEANAGFATIILLFIVFASLLAVLSILKLCCDAGLIKNKSFNKLVKFGVVVFALALVILSVVTMIVIPTNCEAYSFGGLASIGNHANWLTLILVTVVNLLSLATSYFSTKK